MEGIKRFFTENWKPKLISLGISIAFWYLVTDHLDGDRREIPVPGTSAPSPGPRGGGGSALEQNLLNPLIPPSLPTPLPIPVPGVKGDGI